MMFMLNKCFYFFETIDNDVYTQYFKEINETTEINIFRKSISTFSALTFYIVGLYNFHFNIVKAFKMGKFLDLSFYFFPLYRYINIILYFHHDIHLTPSI